jgi:hypothetical protein
LGADNIANTAPTLSPNREVALEKKYDAQFRVVFDAIRQLMAPPTEYQKRRRIGFVID